YLNESGARYEIFKDFYLLFLTLLPKNLISKIFGYFSTMRLPRLDGDGGVEGLARPALGLRDGLQPAPEAVADAHGQGDDGAAADQHLREGKRFWGSGVHGARFFTSCWA
ncbi:hypothetical protein P3G55_23045, partial [Leptospira sp. 96542]|nr:hypothetical protein [Leptospira sp. 96542]